MNLLHIYCGCYLKNVYITFVECINWSLSFRLDSTTALFGTSVLHTYVRNILVLTQFISKYTNLHILFRCYLKIVIINSSDSHTGSILNEQRAPSSPIDRDSQPFSFATSVRLSSSRKILMLTLISSYYEPFTYILWVLPEKCLYYFCRMH